MDKKIEAADGAPIDAGGHDYAKPEHLARFKDASDELSRFKAPTFLHAGSSTDRLVVVAFDGTGNNKYTDPDHATNVAKISDEFDALSRHDARVHVIYIEGPGTTGSRLQRGYDSATGASFEDNIEKAYERLVAKANEWRAETPGIKVSVQTIGFSRGASQAAGFANILHERGIPDTSAEVVWEGGAYKRRFITPAEQVPNAIGIFDPVATGVPMQFDRRLPSSVVSGFQITAKDEFRASFPSDQIIQPGLSADGRFLNITVPGAHSDVGGGYLRNGLSIRSGNLMRDYLAAFNETPSLVKEFEPTDTRFNVLHRSVEGQHIFRLDPRVGVRGTPSGTNLVLAPEHANGAGSWPQKPAELDPHLAMPTRPIPIGPPTTEPNPHLSFARPTAAQLAEAGRGPSYAGAVGRVVGVGATVADVVASGSAAADAFESGNHAGAMSQVVHFAGRNAGGWAGAAAFASAAGAAGVETGPGALVAAGIGGIVGGVAGERLAKEYDQYRIHNQRDAQGNTWTLDTTHGWSQRLPALPDHPRGQVVIASPELSRRLSFQASNTAVELALANEYQPKDPYRQPPSEHDSRTTDAVPWVRDTETKAWSRHITDQWLEHGMSRSHVEVASPQRAAELEASAEKIIQENIAQSPLGVAERYLAVYEQERWHELGKIPEAVQHATLAPTEKVLASDGHTYTHDRSGDWSSPSLFGARHATDNLKEELDRGSEVARGTSRKVNDELASIDRASMAPPAKPTRLDDKSHPDHELFKQARAHVANLDKTLGRTPDQYTDNLASALTVQARKDGLSRIDQIALSDDGSRLWAVQTPPGRKDHLFDLQTKVPTNEATTPMEQSAAQWPAAMQQFQVLEQDKAIAQQQTLERQQQESMGRGMSR
ncbi:T6SS phospholipase effector Tle1-like catalytic domain-containing protein [Luteibacter aegosomatissinici]|uniref:T6SS phospholipase effector Tle1-like catalytic domain-containing protein n=1 Tax=Luteibacter aegosomatissinici TaxID=2911539 RepID=UPI001FFB2C75|nr:DUF2235 domain-containing protein [Luteibacter aegosomatissinici]UPG93878.1 DUF2235 domain-containing protein [Luteibacter aegosomatissinici]